MENSFYNIFISGDIIIAFFFHMQRLHNSWRTLCIEVGRELDELLLRPENVSEWCPERRLNIKMSSYQYRDPLLKKDGLAIVLSLTWESHTRENGLYIETGPWTFLVFGTRITLNKISSHHERPRVKTCFRMMVSYLKTGSEAIVKWLCRILSGKYTPFYEIYCVNCWSICAYWSFAMNLWQQPYIGI